MKESPGNSNLRIGLALSGGGVRAAAFHCGVLKYLAEQNLLESITHISSVSGGSLIVGLIINESGGHWPVSSEFKGVLDKIKTALTKKSLQRDAILRLFLRPYNWRFILSRANILAQSIETLWGISRNFSELPVTPHWSINGTTAETGKRFRFKNREMGEYQFGYAKSDKIKVATALAMSAAFPGFVGPICLKTSSFNWTNSEKYIKSSSADSTSAEPPLKRLHLYDGGIYDNLGLEPLFDIGKQAVKDPSIEHIFVSDASAPLLKDEIPGPLSWRRFQHLFEITAEQVRSLRVRSFVNYICNFSSAGLYFQIGTDPVSKVRKFADKNIETATSLLKENWLNQPEIDRALKYKTTLGKMKSDDFDLIMRHGFETSRWNYELFF